MKIGNDLPLGEKLQLHAFIRGMIVGAGMVVVIVVLLLLWRNFSSDYCLEIFAPEETANLIQNYLNEIQR
jgi:hypothetical protein